MLGISTVNGFTATGSDTTQPFGCIENYELNANSVGTDELEVTFTVSVKTCSKPGVIPCNVTYVGNAKRFSDSIEI